MAHDQTTPSIDWWKATIPASANSAGATIRYAVALFNTNVQAISDALPDKLYGLNESSITNFNPDDSIGLDSRRFEHEQSHNWTSTGNAHCPSAGIPAAHRTVERL